MARSGRGRWRSGADGEERRWERECGGSEGEGAPWRLAGVGRARALVA